MRISSCNFYVYIFFLNNKKYKQKINKSSNQQIQSLQFFFPFFILIVFFYIIVGVCESRLLVLILQENKHSSFRKCYISAFDVLVVIRIIQLTLTRLWYINLSDLIRI